MESVYQDTWIQHGARMAFNLSSKLIYPLIYLCIIHSIINTITTRVYPLKYAHGLVQILTPNMLDCFKDDKRCLHISYHILDFVHQKENRFTIEQPYMLPILYYQYHACWCSGDYRSHNFSKHDIDPPMLEYSISSIRRVHCLCVFIISTFTIFEQSVT